MLLLLILLYTTAFWRRPNKRSLMIYMHYAFMPMGFQNLGVITNVYTFLYNH